MLSFLKHWLEKKNWYLQLRYHPLTISAWLKLRKPVARKLSGQKKLYQSVLENLNKKLIVDVGANEGFLTSIFTSFGFDVVAIEPSQRNFLILKTRFAKTSNVKLMQAALSDGIGQGFFFENVKDHAVSTLSEKWKMIREEKYLSKKNYNDAVLVQTITLDEVIEKFGVPGFIKIDVEGHEEKVLKGLTQAIPLISFEAILPQFMEETINSIEHLFSLSENASFNYTAGYRLAYDHFVSKNELIQSLKSLPPQTIEIFCKSQL